MNRSTSQPQNATATIPPPAPAQTRADAFPWKLFLAAVCIIVGGHVFSAALHEKLHEAVHHVAWVTGFFALASGGLMVCARTLYRHRLSHEPLVPGAVGALLCGHWLALDVHHLLVKQEITPWLLVVVGVAVVVLAALVAHQWRHELEGGRAIIRQSAATYIKPSSPSPPSAPEAGALPGASVLPAGEPSGGISLRPAGVRKFLGLDTAAPSGRPIRGLILIVSRNNANQSLALAAGPDASPWARVILGKDIELSLPGRDLRADINALQAAIAERKPPWNWQQLLRAVEPHAANLQGQHVWLVGSPDDDQATYADTPDYIKQAQAYLHRYMPDVLFHCTRGVNLEDFDALLKVLREDALKPAHREFGLAHNTLAVDITGGQKIASVAGAVLTLNLHVVCQYVPTLRLAGTAKGPASKEDIEAIRRRAAENDPCQPVIYDFRWDKSLVIE